MKKRTTRLHIKAAARDVDVVVLSAVVGVGFRTSQDINNWLKGAREPHAVGRPGHRLQSERNLEVGEGMSESSKFIRYLSALLALATAVALATGYAATRTGGVADLSSWWTLLSQVTPSLIAALIAYVAVYFALERQGVFFEVSREERATAVARELFKYRYGDPSRVSTAVYDISGRWRLRDWRHDHPKDIERAFSEDALVYQDGTVVWGTFSTWQGPEKKGKPTKSRYAFQADLEGNILTGRWWQLNENNPWKGAFQFKYTPGNANREVMDGRWVGFSFDKVEINSGCWEWARRGQPFPSERGGAEPANLRPEVEAASDQAASEGSSSAVGKANDG